MPIESVEYSPPVPAVDIFLVVPAVVISAVGDDEQGSFIVSSATHFAETEIYRIKKRSAAFPLKPRASDSADRRHCR